LRERSVNWEDPALSSNVPWSTIIVESWLMSFESGRGRDLSPEGGKREEKKGGETVESGEQRGRRGREDSHWD